MVLTNTHPIDLKLDAVVSEDTRKRMSGCQDPNLPPDWMLLCNVDNEPHCCLIKLYNYWANFKMAKTYILLEVVQIFNYPVNSGVEIIT